MGEDDDVMESEKLEVLLIHKHPEFLEDCCRLINDEWPRSEQTRKSMLQSSRDNLPTNLILVNDGKQVIGHCKLTKIPSIPTSCFIEVVVISKHLRGRKLGTFLMKHVEDYCRNILKLEMVHLSTIGKEGFYAKLGYQVCEPISIYGCLVQNMVPITQNNISNSSRVSYSKQSMDIVQSGFAPPPPPMPCVQSVPVTFRTNKTYMCKYL